MFNYYRIQRSFESNYLCRKSLNSVRERESKSVCEREKETQSEGREIVAEKTLQHSEVHIKDETT